MFIQYFSLLVKKIFSNKNNEFYFFLFMPFLLSGVSVMSAYGMSVSCPQFFVGGQAPDITNQKEMKDTYLLCHKAYSNLYSAIVMDPLWSADILTTKIIIKDKGAGRHGEFHPEDGLPASFPHLTTLDYRNPEGAFIDRGHMVPNGDMSTPILQNETFSMANVVPQDADNNEQLHEGIETAVRNLAGEVGKIYVVTGPIFHGEHLQQFNHKAFVPTMIFKAVYIPSKGAAAYVENNEPGMKYAVISINELKTLAGLDVFPALTEEEKNNAIGLPVPTPTFREGSREAKALGFRDGKPVLVSLSTLLNDKDGIPYASTLNQPVEERVRHLYKRHREFHHRRRPSMENYLWGRSKSHLRSYLRRSLKRYMEE